MIDVQPFIDKLVCGCLLCNGKCSKGASRRRGEEIGMIANEDIGTTPKFRERYRKSLNANMQVVDCSIILKQLKRILNGN